MCSTDEVAKVRQFTLRSYVEDSRKLTWCPAPGCEHAVECTADIGAEPLDVTCNCGSTFCFTCKEEAHRPVRDRCSPSSGLTASCTVDALAGGVKALEVPASAWIPRPAACLERTGCNLPSLRSILGKQERHVC